jgi:hypothetical protein
VIYCDKGSKSLKRSFLVLGWSFRPIRAGLCRMLDLNFGEFTFPDVG